VHNDASGGARLTREELGAWRGLLRAQSVVLRELDAELGAAHAPSLCAFERPVVLEDAPEHRLRMSDLSHAALLRPSGVTSLVDRLQREGFVTRQRSTSVGRGHYAVLTATGARRLQKACRTHLEGVRRLFPEACSAAELRELARLWDKVVPEAAGSDAEWRRGAAMTKEQRRAGGAND